MSKKQLSRRDFLKMTAGGAVVALTANIVPSALAAPATRQGMYTEAPMLADLVASGDLPPVDERIPTNPRVITPYSEVGEYGGTWHRAFKGISDRWGPTKLQEEMILEWDAFDPEDLKVVPNYISEWSQNDDATEFTFTLREGLKWSDGIPFTTEDVQFAHDLLAAKVLNPPAHLEIGGELCGLEIVDELTWKISFVAPNPLLPITFARTSAGGITGGPTLGAPKHYLEKFLGDSPNADQDAIDAALEATGLNDWTELWYDSGVGDGQGVIPFYFRNPDLPIINAWRSANTPLDDPYVLERNPYYHAVDTEGNQLPYIDHIQHALFEDTETLNLWVAQGLIDMQTRHLSAADFTFFKENEEAGDYHVVLWKAAWTHAFYPNISSPNTALAALFDTAEFREALSISINRQEINDLVYNGLLEPRQASPVSGALEYDPEFESRWTEYDPDLANELLDGIGMTERDGDGWRKYPNGDSLSFTITWTDAGFAGSPDEVQMVVDAWRAIGLNVNQELVERSLYEQRNQEGTNEIGVWQVDRSSVVKADPTRYIGTVGDGPWAINYARWVAVNLYGETHVGTQTEPPEDHLIRRIHELWNQTKQEPDEATRNALFKELLDIHKEHPYQIGVVGEDPIPVVVKNNLFNVGSGYIYDDALRSQGICVPAQLFFRT
jgi:peptide/nickel transport system substrate-binding protein